MLGLFIYLVGLFVLVAIYNHDVCLIVNLRFRLSDHHKRIKRVFCLLFGLESFNIYMHASLANRTSQTHQVQTKELVSDGVSISELNWYRFYFFVSVCT